MSCKTLSNISDITNKTYALLAKINGSEKRCKNGVVTTKFMAQWHPHCEYHIAWLELEPMLALILDDIRSTVDQIVDSLFL